MINLITELTLTLK